MKEKQQKLM